ncbi:hypothetical protein [Microcella alkaliphila]|uniref:Uncharacterized protein n=1 Tax=Microcella alkaliphila TaxID=279828 RepID=A0A0U5BCZ5_9MICO|nr:hypothetical protein [Microcella alkaliphila]BAU32497.1 uncharacterized protein MalAC0309_1646 [Microcella alkaliphila]
MTTTRLHTLDGPPTLPASPSSAPSGSAAPQTRSGRRAPAPIRHLARLTVLGVVFVGIHAAASHPLAAVTVAAVLFAVLYFTPSRR